MKVSHIHNTLTHFLNDHIPVFIWGAPGIGKSSVVKQVAHDNNRDFIDLRLSLLDPTDLKGIPYFEKEHNHAIWASPNFLPHDANSKGILFLDEINTAAPSVQASAYQLILDRKVGDYSLPDGWSIVAAGNRENDRGVTYRMPAPLANRFVHLEMHVDFDDWKTWAYAEHLDSSIIGFLNFDNTQLFVFEPEKNEKSFPTPRSWEYVHKILASKLDESLLLETISGAVGEKSAVDFVSFRKVMHLLPDIEAILNGSLTTLSEEDHKVLFALCAGITNHLLKEPKKEYLSNVLTFSLSMLPEFSVMLLKDIQKSGLVVENLPEWENWIRKHSYLLH